MDILTTAASNLRENFVTVNKKVKALNLSMLEKVNANIPSFADPIVASSQPVWDCELCFCTSPLQSLDKIGETL